MDGGKVYICVSQEQRELIHAMFHHNGWEVQEMEMPDPGENNSQVSLPDEELEYRIPPIEGEMECEHCLSRPCVTSERYKQLWWEDREHAPSRRNSKKRKVHYKRFWVMLLHRGVWKDPRYIQRKNNAAQQDNLDMVWSGPAGCFHPRDIMPKCVLGLVRRWLPNLPTQPYMGHRWS